MKKYYMIDLSERNTREELKTYTIEELKHFFAIKDIDTDNTSEIEKIQDIYDLEEYLRKEADGMAVHYQFKEA